MTDLDETTAVRDLLSRAAAVPPLGDPVPDLLRRRARARIRLAAAGTTALAAVVALGLTVEVPVLRLPFTGQAGPAAVVEDGVARLGDVSVTVPAGFSAEVSDEACVRPRTVAVLPDVVGTPGGREGCTDGPWIALTRTARAGTTWTTTAGPQVPARLVLVGDVAAWETTWRLPAADGYATWKLPALGVMVTVTGTGPERSRLLAAVRTTPRDAVDERPLLSRPDLVAAFVSTAAGTDVWSTRDPVLLGRLRAILEAAPRVPRGAWCVPDPADAVQLDVSASTDGDPETGPPSAPTSFVVGTSDACRLAYSSTGAVVLPDPGAVSELFSAMRSGDSPAPPS